MTRVTQMLFAAIMYVQGLCSSAAPTYQNKGKRFKVLRRLYGLEADGEQISGTDCRNLYTLLAMGFVTVIEVGEMVKMKQRPWRQGNVGNTRAA